jgi:nitrate reductase / nitrite oxidoreductase, beta subunit
LPLFPQFGLEPNVYYIPPVQAPEQFLRQMFGPGASAAVKSYRAAADDADLGGLLGLFGCTERVVPRWRRQGDSVIGAQENGDEIIRVPLREPVFVREAFDKKYQVTRTNCP